MNVWILGSGLLGLATALIHLFAGQVDPVRPFLKSSLDDVPKATLLACWHLVSVTLLVCSVALIYVGLHGLATFYVSTLLIGVLFVIFSVVFILVGGYFFSFKGFIKLPQWILLLPIGALAIAGSVI